MNNMNRAHHFLRFLILAVLIGLSLAAAARAADTPPAQIAVSPSKFELEIGSKPTTESVTLVNVGKHDVDIQVTLANWDLDQSNRVRILEPDEQSLDQWIAICCRPSPGVRSCRCGCGRARTTLETIGWTSYIRWHREHA